MIYVPWQLGNKGKGKDKDRIIYNSICMLILNNKVSGEIYYI